MSVQTIRRIAITAALAVTLPVAAAVTQNAWKWHDQFAGGGQLPRPSVP
ncbi:hypothetical protein [Polymorphospora rubra]